MLTAFYLLLTYLFASVPTGLILGIIVADVDPRDAGSGNIGATNVRRLLGNSFGAITLFGDLLKGFVPVALMPTLLPDADPALAGVAALAAVIGHCYSAYLDFNGGKGVATAAGALLGLNPLVMVLCLAAWFTMVTLTRRSSMGGLASAVLMPFLLGWLSPIHLWAGLAMMGIVLLRHQRNIARLWTGREPQVDTDPLLQNTHQTDNTNARTATTEAPIETIVGSTQANGAAETNQP